MAAVLLARDTQLDRLVALKVLPPENAKDRETLERFHQEAKNGAKLDHENIARVYSSGQDQGLHFLALEYVEGETFKKLVDRMGRLPLALALPYIHQAALGLDHAASKGVVHRDIKPSNLLVTSDGKVKLVDLGLAKSLAAPAEEALTRYGATLGTFDYLAPEQALDPRRADSRSDIYSLGCTFYHMITGRSPVPDGSAAVKLAFHQQSKPVDPRRIVPEIPSVAVGLLDRMLEKKPENRFATPADLVRAIEGVAGSLHIELNRQSEKTKRQKPLRQASLIGILLVLFFGGLGIYLFDWNHAGKENAWQASKPQPGKGVAGTLGSVKSKEEVQAKGEPLALFDGKDTTALELADWLEANAGKDKLEIVLHGDLDLSDLRDRPDAGLLVSGKNVVIRSAHPGRRVTIRFHFDGRVLSGPWAMVALDAESV
ncbi:MAG: serine/threonine-protein kinase, partial [Gemmataceae bacterium]